MRMVLYEHAGAGQLQWGWAKDGEIGLEEVLGEAVIEVEVEEVKGEGEDGILCPDGVRRTPIRRWALHGEGGLMGYLVEV